MYGFKYQLKYITTLITSATSKTTAYDCTTSTNAFFGVGELDWIPNDLIRLLYHGDTLPGSTPLPLISSLIIGYILGYVTLAVTHLLLVLVHTESLCTL